MFFFSERSQYLNSFGEVCICHLDMQMFNLFQEAVLHEVGERHSLLQVNSPRRGSDQKRECVRVNKKSFRIAKYRVVFVERAKNTHLKQQRQPLHWRAAR